ncbi:GntR family transcriptional regulator [Neobacillus piezotolerans]|uniref:GntR family transcriptional regulator n=1 Tax=Neobacillus piezotolerans TaxID=2259171 RepID=A0A3D8GTM2_9BACI|nr:GntR family transcriptional regulator [Neobacillus piezotolerans]RDU37820.1 GntR family transcriptional regulator [Neobacillus piezotolerans]
MDIILSNNSDLPIYQQIKNQMIQQIMKGDLKDGEQLPSIRNLAKELKISVITTKRAYDDLEKEGYIDTVIGKGTFVSVRGKNMLKQKQFETINGKLKLIVKDCKQYDIPLHEVLEMIKKLYEEE